MLKTHSQLLGPVKLLFILHIPAYDCNLVVSCLNKFPFFRTVFTFFESPEKFRKISVKHKTKIKYFVSISKKDKDTEKFLKTEFQKCRKFYTEIKPALYFQTRKISDPINLFKRNGAPGFVKYFLFIKISFTAQDSNPKFFIVPNRLNS